MIAVFGAGTRAGADSRGAPVMVATIGADRDRKAAGQMGRRHGLPWAPTSLPLMRRQMCENLGAALAHIPLAADQAAQAGDHDTAAQYLQTIADADRDIADLKAAELYWVARNMVDLAVDAAASLPEWSPRAAMPVESGLLCWAKPSGTFRWPVPGSDETVAVDVDSMSWAVRDGRVGVFLGFRWERVGERLSGLIRPTSIVPHPCGVWDLDEPVSHRLESGAVSPLSVLGAAWLLMSQPTVAQSRRLEPAGGRSGRSVDGADDARDGEAVSLIELRRLADNTAHQPQPGQPGRAYNKRWWVGGHWRQQSWGPKHALRKPVWIAPHLKGPESAPLSTRVNVWRR